MQSNEEAHSAASQMVNNSTPVYLVKLMEAGAEYQLSDEQRGKAEQIAGAICRDHRVKGSLQEFADRLAQVPDLAEFAASIRSFFLHEGRAQSFTDEGESVEHRRDALENLSFGGIAMAFIVTYVAAVTLLSDSFGSVAPPADQEVAELLTLIPWAISFPIAGSVALCFAQLLWVKK